MKERIAVLLIVGLVVGVAAGCGVVRASGELPTWTVGDSWLFINVVNGTSYDLNQTVTGEATIRGIDCYVLNLTYEPDTPYAATANPLDNDMLVWIDKSTLRTVYVDVGLTNYGGRPTAIVNISYTYDVLTGDDSWPRTVGQEWTVNTTIVTTAVVGALVVPVARESNLTLVKVEDFINVTVPAGEFECFYIATYDVTGEDLLLESWYSDDVRTSVKIIDYSTLGYKSSLYEPDTMELVPEFPTWTSMLLVLTALTVAIATYKRRRARRPFL